MVQLYFNHKLSRHYLVGSQDYNLFCYKCKKIIEFDNTVIIHRSFSKNSYEKQYYCEGCIKHHHKRTYDEFKIALFTHIIPDNSIIIPDYPPSLTVARNDTVFSMAIKDDDTIIVDRTKIAGKESWNQSQIGNDPEDRIKELDSTFDKLKAGGLRYIKQLRDSHPAIEHDGVKQLE